jgi:muramoyltetrapeptide carboxypeptidase
MSPSRVARLFCPSGAVSKDAYDAGVQALGDLGLDGVSESGVFAVWGYFAGEHGTRAERLSALLRETTGPLWMIRGGFGAIHTLSHGLGLFDGVAPRELWAFSDGTALLSAWGKLHWPAWHAPPLVQLPRLDAMSRKRVKRAYVDGVVPSFTGLLTLNQGIAHGPLMGGNLSVLASMVGTPFQADLGGSILLLEDVGETAYRVDRLFTQLELSGALKGVQGLALGEFTDVSAQENEKIRAFFGSAAQRLALPAVWDVPIGHGVRNAPVPFGTASGFKARLRADAKDGRLEILRD